MCHGTWQPWRHQKSAGGAGASCAQALKTGQLKQGTRWHLFSDTDDVVLIPDLEDGPCHLLCQSKRVTSINPLRPTWNRHSACKGTTTTPRGAVGLPKQESELPSQPMPRNASGSSAAMSRRCTCILPGHRQYSCRHHVFSTSRKENEPAGGRGWRRRPEKRDHAPSDCVTT